MADPRFFARSGPFSLEALAGLTGATLRDPKTGGLLLTDVAPLESAGPEDLTFLDNRKYLDAFARSRAGAGQIGRKPGIAVGVATGEGCRVAANVTLGHCVIGARVVLHTGVRIGQAGFGFAPDAEGPVKIPQLGRLIVGDDVDIGAN